MLNEELLSVWLRMSNVINNQRLVTGLSFNEALVCNLLLRAKKQDLPLTAKDLCAETRILKSQMNSILLSLEKKGAVCRLQSRQDRRQVEIRLTEEGVRQYQQAHLPILQLIDRLIAAQGEESVRQLIPMLHQVVDTFDQIQQEA